MNLHYLEPANLCCLGTKAAEAAVSKHAANAKRRSPNIPVSNLLSFLKEDSIPCARLNKASAIWLQWKSMAIAKPTRIHIFECLLGIFKVHVSRKGYIGIPMFQQDCSVAATWAHGGNTLQIHINNLKKHPRSLNEVLILNSLGCIAKC